MSLQPAAAETFHRLHHSGLLRLANAWDAGSARLIESLGAKAIATTSAGVAWANGYPDGDQLPVARLRATVDAIARVVRVPLSVDVEGGYSDDPATVADNVASLLELGAVGINIEDGAASPLQLCAKIEHVKRAASRLGINVFVNARTDVYLRGLAAPDQRVAETAARAAFYRDAGADGVFVPGLRASDEIAAVVASVALPVNVLALQGVPDADALAALGVRRLSAGSDLAEHLFGHLSGLVDGFLREGVVAPQTVVATGYSGLNALFAGN